MTAQRVLSICTGMGLLDRAFLDEGFEVVPGCEVDADMRALYQQVCGNGFIANDIREMTAMLKDAPRRFAGVIGGPPCQAHSKLRARWEPRFPDLTAEVQETLDAVGPEWFLFENVVPVQVQGAERIRLDAMHYGKPHQSRPRWFSHSPNLTPPEPLYNGDSTSLLAYPGVYGKLYGLSRAAIIQGYPAARGLDAPSRAVVRGLANAVHYGLAREWARSVRRAVAA